MGKQCRHCKTTEDVNSYKLIGCSLCTPCCDELEELLSEVITDFITTKIDLPPY